MLSKIVVAVSLVLFASAASAYPAWPSNEPTVAQASQQCGKNQVISCCNTLNNNEAGGANLANNILGDCTDISVLSMGISKL
jgi:hypothetical protein